MQRYRQEKVHAANSRGTGPVLRLLADRCEGRSAPGSSTVTARKRVPCSIARYRVMETDAKKKKEEIRRIASQFFSSSRFKLNLSDYSIMIAGLNGSAVAALA